MSIILFFNLLYDQFILFYKSESPLFYFSVHRISSLFYFVSPSVQIILFFSPPCDHRFFQRCVSAKIKYFLVWLNFCKNVQVLKKIITYLVFSPSACCNPHISRNHNVQGFRHNIHAVNSRGPLSHLARLDCIGPLLHSVICGLPHIFRHLSKVFLRLIFRRK